MSRTTQLLIEWRDGNGQALDDLLKRHMSRIRGLARMRLGSRLRSKLESRDIAQDAVLNFLRNGPRVIPANGAQFRALMSRIVESTISDKHKWFESRKREIFKESGGHEALLDLSKSRRPDEELSARERDAAIRLGYELLGPEERRIHIRRHADRVSYSDIGRELGISEDAARKRCKAASERLQAFLLSLRLGTIDDFLA
ncbi:MAG: sigma-70 family RNA polymerase sigma factor [Planctomycetota bacterium]